MWILIWYYSEIKTREKLREKEEAKKKKEEEKKAKAASQPKKEKEVELDPTQYTENRKQWIQSVRDKSENPYPHKFNRTHKLDEFHAAYDTKITEKSVFLEE